MAYEFDTEQSGDIMDDVVYERNQYQDRFNLNLEYIVEPGNWAIKIHTSRSSPPRCSQMTTYDIVTGQSNIIIPLAVQGMFYDALTQNTDYTALLERGLLRQHQHQRQVYVLGGDFAISMLSASNVIFFNKDLMDEYQIEYPYDLVRNGTWTVDKFFEMAKCTGDLNGDGFMEAKTCTASAATTTRSAVLLRLRAVVYVKGEDGKR